jgi:phage terminase large subunit GpA-like protein
MLVEEAALQVALYSPETMDSIDEMEDRVMALLAPPARILPSEWARTNYWITTGSRKGFMVPDPYQIEIMDAAADSEVHEIIFKKPQQIGWSAILNVYFMWNVAVHAEAVLMVQPSVDSGEKYCKDRLDPAIENCEVLNELLVLPTAKKGASTTRNKYFSNGASFFCASGTAPKELRSYSCPKIALDERSGMRVDVGGEGDPGMLARGRAETYDNWQVLEGSTPALPPGIDPIDTSYERSSKGLYHVPCPHCQAMQPLTWRHPFKTGEYMLQFVADPITKKVDPESVHYRCLYCGEQIDESSKIAMIEAGKWVHQRPEIRDVRGYWINSLYLCARRNWHAMAQEWVDAQGSPSKLRTFIHVRLAECWEERGQAVSPNWLRELADQDERPRGIVPDGAAIVEVTCDVQDGGGGRLEASVVAWFPNEAAVLVDHQIFPGDPLQPDCWDDFDAWRLAGWQHANGARIQAHIVLIDASSGGHQDAVYSYCQPRMAEGVFPIKATNSISSPGYAQDCFTKKNTIRFFLIPTDATKQAVYGRLAQPVGQTRSIALPKWVSEEYLAQISSEKRLKVENPKTGGISYQWIKLRPRNEALDIWSYQIAGWWILTKILYPDLGGPDGQAYLESLARQASASHETVEYAQTVGRRIRSKGYGG